MPRDPVRLEGLEDVRRGLERVSRDAPHIFTSAIAERLTKTSLPVIDARAPRGKTGRLARGTRVKVIDDGQVALENTVAYANAIHWGREFWPNKAKQKHRAPIAKRPFIYDTVIEQRESLAAAVAQDLERVLHDALHTHI